MKELLQIYFKGMLMGVSDLVPGISGGTIAFITGIYQRLISVISKLHPQQFLELLKAFFKTHSTSKFSSKKSKESDSFTYKFKKFDFDFLTILLAGVLTSIFLGAAGISYIFENYKQYTLAFFIGLILSSAFLIYESLEKRKSTFFLIIAGVILGSMLLFLPQQNLEYIPLYVIFLGGFIASSAMILPGISGSFILLILGIYPFVLSFINSPIVYYKELSILLIGVVCGILLLSKIINMALKNYKENVMGVLCGLVLGSLLIPLEDVITYASSSNLFFILFLFILGIGAGIGIKLLSSYNFKVSQNKKI